MSDKTFDDLMSWFGVIAAASGVIALIGIVIIIFRHALS